MIVKEVKAEASGTYLCTAMDGAGKTAQKTIEVAVNYPPRVDVSEVVIHALSGDVAELICKVVGEPKPQVAWSKGGSIVHEDSRIGIHHENTRHYLTIKQIKQEDLGMYTCTARNALGMSHKDITLTESITGTANRMGFVFCPTIVAFSAVFVIKNSFMDVGQFSA